MIEVVGGEELMKQLKVEKVETVKIEDAEDVVVR